MVLAFCTSSNVGKYLYEVPWRYFERFLSYRAEKTISQNLLFSISKGHNSKNIQSRVTVLALCMSSHIALHLCKVSWKYLKRFLSYRADTFLWQTDERTDRRTKQKQYVIQPYWGRHNCKKSLPGIHTCEPLLLDMREIWFSFQGDWGLHQGDYSMAFLTSRLKLFSIKLERNFKKYMNYSTLCFQFTLKLTKISTKYIKTERFHCN